MIYSLLKSSIIVTPDVLMLLNRSSVCVHFLLALPSEKMGTFVAPVGYNKSYCRLTCFLSLKKKKKMPVSRISLLFYVGCNKLQKYILYIN